MKSAGDRRTKSEQDFQRFPWEPLVRKTSWTKEKLKMFKKLKPKWFKNE
jgi:hypothetical protein